MFSLMFIFNFFFWGGAGICRTVGHPFAMSPIYLFSRDACIQTQKPAVATLFLDFTLLEEMRYSLLNSEELTEREPLVRKKLLLLTICSIDIALHSTKRLCVLKSIICYLL